MPHSEIVEEEFRYFDDWEDEAIEKWLKDRDYQWSFPTLCGSCCGFYDAQYWVHFRPGDIAKFNAFACEQGIGAVATQGCISMVESNRESESA